MCATRGAVPSSRGAGVHDARCGSKCLRNGVRDAECSHKVLRAQINVWRVRNTTSCYYARPLHTPYTPYTPHVPRVSHKTSAPYVPRASHTPYAPYVAHYAPRTERPVHHLLQNTLVVRNSVLRPNFVRQNSKVNKALRSVMVETIRLVVGSQCVAIQRKVAFSSHNGARALVELQFYNTAQALLCMCHKRIKSTLKRREPLTIIHSRCP